MGGWCNNDTKLDDSARRPEIYRKQEDQTKRISGNYAPAESCHTGK